MTAVDDVTDDILQELAIALETLVAPCLLGILLDSPHGPQGHIRLFNLVDLHRQGLTFHELTEPLLGGLHHQLEVVTLANRQGESW